MKIHGPPGFPFTDRSCPSPATFTRVADPWGVTGDERSALLLTARLLESGVVVEDPDLDDDGGHVNIALSLAERLQRVASDPAEARQIVAALRAAAEEPAEV
jgi:hypothetical protein